MAASVVVIPNPRIPSVLGTLNVVFGILLLVSSLMVVGWTLAQRHLIKMTQITASEEREKRVAEFDARIAALEKTLSVAKDPSARLRIQDDIDRVVEEHDGDEIALEALDNPQLKHPITAIPFWADHILGMLLNALMIAAGTGLIALRGWGRKLALQVAALKLVKLTVVMGLAVFLTIPFQVMRSRQMWARIEARSSSAAPLGASFGTQIAQMTAVTMTGQAVGFGFLGMAYPILTLWLLNKRSARAAFLLPRHGRETERGSGGPSNLS